MLKKVKNLAGTLINMLKNEVNVLYKLKDIFLSPQIYYYNFNENNNKGVIVSSWSKKFIINWDDFKYGEFRFMASEINKNG